MTNKFKLKVEIIIFRQIIEGFSSHPAITSITESNRYCEHGGIRNNESWLTNKVITLLTFELARWAYRTTMSWRNNRAKS